MDDAQTVLYTVEAGVATLTLNRPTRRNALTPAMLQALLAAFQQAGQDEQVRAILITGAGKGFCAGQDLSIFDGTPAPDAVREIILQYYRPLIESICQLEKPVIAAINGVAAGAGASLALACDLRIMADDASLLMAFSNIGLVPDAGASWFLTRLVGYSRAYEIAISGERVTATRCLDLGLTNRVTAVDGLLTEAQQWAHQLAQRPTVALGLTKRVMRQATTADLASILAAEAALQAQATLTADHREGVLAFAEKRPPVFTGR
ncbi:MAG: enoyl-CoA hydratase/isomerase family protein [Caldilineaceae bacterium]|nr:enoyl-CoA hydratase/isomerase family protein [Caldilineaceae bacterium]